MALLVLLLALGRDEAPPPGVGDQGQGQGYGQGPSQGASDGAPGPVWAWRPGRPLSGAILASSLRSTGNAILEVGVPTDDAACARACQWQVPRSNASAVYTLPLAAAASCQCLLIAAEGCMPLGTAPSGEGVYMAGVPCDPDGAPGDGVELGMHAAGGAAARCGAALCPAGEWLRGCHGASAGSCTAQRPCADDEDCLALSGQGNDCTCVSRGKDPVCPSGQESIAGNCFDCRAASAAKPYHTYRARMPLLRHCVLLYIDADDSVPRFRAASYSEVQPDAGALELAPAALPARPLFEAGARLTVDTARGLVYREGHAPPEAPRMQGVEYMLGAWAVPLDAVTALSVVPLEDPPPEGDANHLWDALMPEALLGDRVELAAGSGRGSYGARPAVAFRARGAPFRACVGCLQAVHIHSLLELGVGGQSADGAGVFDYSAFAWASGRAAVAEGDAPQAPALGPIDGASAMETMLVADLPVGRWEGAAFLPVAGAQTTRVAFMNRSRPSTCLSYCAREG